MSLLVPCESTTLVTTSGPLQHRCPHVDEVDNGRIVITWRPAGMTLELHALAEYLSYWADVKVSHEEITDQVFRDLSEIEVGLIEVTTTWETAGLEVTCSTSPTPAATQP